MEAATNGAVSVEAAGAGAFGSIVEVRGNILVREILFVLLGFTVTQALVLGHRDDFFLPDYFLSEKIKFRINELVSI